MLTTIVSRSSTELKLSHALPLLRARAPHTVSENMRLSKWPFPTSHRDHSNWHFLLFSTEAHRNAHLCTTLSLFRKKIQKAFWNVWLKVKYNILSCSLVSHVMSYRLKNPGTALFHCCALKWYKIDGEGGKESVRFMDIMCTAIIDLIMQHNKKGHTSKRVELLNQYWYFIRRNRVGRRWYGWLSKHLTRTHAHAHMKTLSKAFTHKQVQNTLLFIQLQGQTEKPDICSDIMLFTLPDGALLYCALLCVVLQVMPCA